MPGINVSLKKSMNVAPWPASKRSAERNSIHALQARRSRADGIIRHLPVWIDGFEELARGRCRWKRNVEQRFAIGRKVFNAVRHTGRNHDVIERRQPIAAAFDIHDRRSFQQHDRFRRGVCVIRQLYARRESHDARRQIFRAVVAPTSASKTTPG